MASIFEGIRVVDFTIGQVGPYASAMLADLGAEVIHVEEPGRGDQTRGTKTFHGVSVQLPGGRGSVFFEECNRNKKSITLDIRKVAGREILLKLVEKSDVFMTNFRTRVLTKYGLDAKTLWQRNPKLIYAASSGLGRKGPDADKPSIDFVVNARSGAMMASGEPGMPPIVLPVGMGDRVGALMFGFATLAALYARETKGIVQEVNVSQLGSMMTLLGNNVMASLLLGLEYPRYERQKAQNPLYNCYRCKDGKWIALALWQPDRYWPLLCKTMNLPELENDPRFNSADQRAKNNETLIGLLEDILAKKTRDEWVAILGKSDDLLFSAVKTVSEVKSDRQALANNYIVDWDHPALGKIKFLPLPIELSSTPVALRLPAPELGQHTEEVLTDVCGYSWDDVVRLRDGGAI